MGLTLGQAVEKMRGPVDSDLTISVLRGSLEPFDVTLTRAVIKIRSTRSRLIDDVGYIRITTFNEQTTSGLRSAIKKIKAEKGDQLTGYVIDLRNNPGGLLDEAISVSDTFLEQGEIVSTRGRDPKNASRIYAKPGDLTDGKPLVVLINGGSASASEIVAGARCRIVAQFCWVQKLRQGLSADGYPAFRPDCNATDHGTLLHTVRSLHPANRHRARHRRATCPHRKAR